LSRSLKFQWLFIIGLILLLCTPSILAPNAIYAISGDTGPPSIICIESGEPLQMRLRGEMDIGYIFERAVEQYGRKTIKRRQF
jgi:hypothetical protein